MPRVTSLSEHGRTLRRRYTPIYVASLLLIFHTFVVAYINSSFLEQFISTDAVGTMYMVSSAIIILVFLLVPKVLRRFGNLRLTLTFLFLNALAVLGMAMAESALLAVPLLAIHLILIPLIIFNLDVFMEERIGIDEEVTGSRRGLLFAMMGLMSASAPFIASGLVAGDGGEFTYAYLISALSLIPIVIILLLYFKDFKEPLYNDLKLFTAMRSVWIKKDVRAVFTVHFMLQIFFMTMVVFTPLYLTQHIGLSWAEFGIMMFVCQLAYVIFEYPIGYIADNYIGQKEMMALGLLILAVSTAWISFITVSSVVLWSLVMFITRIGASFVEVTTEVHFFKRTNDADAQLISFFRVTRPLAYLVGAVIASVSLLYLPFNLLFIVIAFLMIPAMFVTLDIVDTK